MINLFKGFIIGIGKVIPGVSGALLAISMNVYDKSIYYVKNFNNNRKSSIKFLIPLGIGIMLGIILFSKIINYLLDNHYSMTMFFFIGLIIGTLINLIKKIKKKNYFLIILSFTLFLFLTFINIKGNYVLKGSFFDGIVMFFSGILEAIGTIVPGVSSTALLMNIGKYKIIVSAIGNIMNYKEFLYNLKIMVPFGIGTIIGIIIMIVIVDYLFKKHSCKVYSVIIGLILSTIIIMIITVLKNSISIWELLMGIVLMIIGIFISSYLDK